LTITKIPVLRGGTSALEGINWELSGWIWRRTFRNLQDKNLGRRFVGRWGEALSLGEFDGDSSHFSINGDEFMSAGRTSRNVRFYSFTTIVLIGFVNVTSQLKGIGTLRSHSCISGSVGRLGFETLSGMRIMNPGFGIINIKGGKVPKIVDFVSHFFQY
jgi:hypothetical protein